MGDSGSIRFSVIVPAHNSAAYVAEAVDSVLAQSHPSVEVVVVDDGSTDNTREVMAAYDRNPRVQTVFLERPHGGPSRPRNVGIAHSRGEIVVMLDADDLLAPQGLEWMDDAFKRAPEAGLAFFNTEMLDFHTGVVFGRCLDEYDSFWRLHRQAVGPDIHLVDDPHLYPQVIETNFIKTSGTGMPRRVLDELGGFDESLTNADDFDMWLRIARAHHYLLIDRPGVRYRRRRGSITDRGGRLVRNRIAVFERQLTATERADARRSAVIMLAQQYAMLGYARSLGLDLPGARQSYRRSLSYGFSWMAVKGLCVTMLPSGFLARKRARQVPDPVGD